jgi:hypothetical protein
MRGTDGRISDVGYWTRAKTVERSRGEGLGPRSLLTAGHGVAIICLVAVVTAPLGSR